MSEGQTAQARAQLRELQRASAKPGADWPAIEHSMAMVAELLAPDDTRAAITASGEDWWLEIGAVDLGQPIIGIHRSDILVAALAQREDGRLRLCAFRPLDGKSASSIRQLAQTPHPEHGVSMRETNWEFALDCAAGMGQHYAADRGESHLAYWANGLGVDSEGARLPEWKNLIVPPPRRAAIVAVELGLDSPPLQQVEPPGSPRIGASAEREHLADRFRGCLLGGAVGDALGAPVEFMSRAEILRRFGPRGISGYAPAYGRLGAITDDTQMTLFTGEGLIRGWVRGCLKGITDYRSTTAGAYLRWARTQGVRLQSSVAWILDPPGWLYGCDGLHHQRAPGNTCLAALSAATQLGEPARNESKGCGGVMRIAPVGLFAWKLQDQWDRDDVYRLGVDLCAVTHGHPTGSVAGGVMAALLRLLCEGLSLSEALAGAKETARGFPHYRETLDAIEKAEEHARAGTEPSAAISALGQGWVAEEALAIGLYCALVASDFSAGVRLAVNHDGDSDSTGSIVGNLLGALHGVSGIPGHWLEGLELRDVITALADDLADFRDWQISDYGDSSAQSDEIWARYPGF